MKIEKYFKGKQFQYKNQKYIFIACPNPVKTSFGSLKLGCYAYNPKTNKTTSLTYISVLGLEKNIEKTLANAKEILIKKIKKEKV